MNPAANLQPLSEWRKFAAENIGRHNVPTLRNVDLRPTGTFAKAYVHNGYFKTLSGLVHFYNTRCEICLQRLAHGTRGARRQLLARARGDGQHEQRRIRQPWPQPDRGARDRRPLWGALSDGYAPVAGQREKGRADK